MKRIALTLLLALLTFSWTNAQTTDEQAAEEFMKEFSALEQLCKLREWTEESLTKVVSKAIKTQDKATQKALKSKKEAIVKQAADEIHPLMMQKVTTFLFGNLETSNLHKLNAFLENPEGQNLVYNLLKAKEIYLPSLSTYSTIAPERKVKQDEFRVTPYADDLYVIILLWERSLEQTLASEETKTLINSVLKQ